MAKKSPPAPAARAKAAPAKDGIDGALVRELATILRDTELSEIEVEKAGLRIRVARQLTIGPQPTIHHAVPRTDLAGGHDLTSAPSASKSPAPTTLDTAQHPGAVKSPMVGTAYAAPQPGAAAFVKLGDEVKEGQTLLIIEAMKTMNQIPAPRGGKITGIYFKDASPVEYGEVLMLIE